MARNVEDLALLLDAMTASIRSDPLSLPRCRHRSCPPHAPARDQSASPIRPISASPRRSRSCASPERPRTLRRAGAIVEEAHPDLREAHDASMCCARSTPISKAALLADQRDLLKPEVIWISRRPQVRSSSSSAPKPSASR